MARNRRSARTAGSRFERDVGLYLTLNTGTKVYRTAKKGSMDAGDLFGLSIDGKQIVIECKSPGKNSSWNLSKWWSETINEKKNCFADMGILIVSIFGQSIKKSACIVDDDNFQLMSQYGDLSSYTIIDIKNGVSEIKKNISHDYILKQKMFGKNDYWYIFPLEILAQLSDKDIPKINLIQDVHGNYESYIGIDSNDVVMEFNVTNSHNEPIRLLSEKSQNSPQYTINISSEEIKKITRDNKSIFPHSPYPLGLLFSNENEDAYNADPHEKEEPITLSYEQWVLLGNGESIFIKVSGGDLILSLEK